MSERKMLYLCLAHMSETGMEQKYVKEAFDTNWVVPMGANVNGFERDLKAFVNRRDFSTQPAASLEMTSEEAASLEMTEWKDSKVVCLSAHTADVHLASIAWCQGKGGVMV